MNNNQPKIFIVSGPSRVGKDAITKGLLRKRSLNLQKVITATSRPKREGEVEGKHYHFLNPEEFTQKIKQGYFLEWAILAGGRYYGTPLPEFDRIKAQNKNVIIMNNIKRINQNTIAFFNLYMSKDSKIIFWLSENI